MYICVIMKQKVVEKRYLFPFIMVTLLFLLWGIANNMTDTLLSAFKRIMSMSDTQTSLIQFAFYGSYFCFALPAALYIKRYSYKAGVILGLCLYASGAILFFPAAKTASYAFYLIAIYILAGGCSVLETTANPYILSMGVPETATRRLNVAQAFNPIGSITGILLSQFFILSELSSASAEQRAAMSPGELEAMQAHELSAVTGTYMTLGFVLLAIMLVMAFAKMPEGSDQGGDGKLGETFRRLFSDKVYARGVIAQFFYNGAQIGCWSFTIRIVMEELGWLEAQAASFYLYAIIGFCVSRFIYTWLMKYFRPSVLLSFGGVMSLACVLVVLFGKGTGMVMVVFLMLTSVFMSLMFPTIYGLALGSISEGAHPEDSKIGASGLIMSIFGGAVITPVQGLVSDHFGIYVSYIVPAVCFAVILAYALYVVRVENGRRVTKA